MLLSDKQIKKKRNKLLKDANPGNAACWQFIEDLIETLKISNKEIEELEQKIIELGEVGIQNDRLKEQLKEVSEYLAYSLL